VGIAGANMVDEKERERRRKLLERARAALERARKDLEAMRANRPKPDNEPPSKKDST
jgi:hypothetical protein